jgi:hypothetical protein
MLNVQWKTPDDGQRNCPKHVEFDKNNFGKLVRLLVLLKRKVLYYLRYSRNSIKLTKLRRKSSAGNAARMEKTRFA